MTLKSEKKTRGSVHSMSCAEVLSSSRLGNLNRCTSPLGVYPKISELPGEVQNEEYNSPPGDGTTFVALR